MIELTGKYTNAKIFTDNVEPDVIKQITFLCNHPLFKDNPIRIMPDTHPGKSTVVGLTVKAPKNAIPSLIGSDIGCGILAIRIKQNKTLNDFAKLDKIIRNSIPSGADHHSKIPKGIFPRIQDEVTELCKKLNWEPSQYLKALGTLGGGNHFISLEKGSTGTYLLIHTGSRNFGKDIAVHYGKLSIEQNPYAHSGELKQLSWLDDKTTIEYEQALRLAVDFAQCNRHMIVQTILKEMGWKQDEIQHEIEFDGIHMVHSLLSVYDIPHNYIDRWGMLRKGSIALHDKTIGIIPINMSDGTLIVMGADGSFGYVSSDWNSSAPHGAGRLLSRQDAKEQLDMKEYKERMKGIYTNSISVNTLDESPMAYKPIEQIKKEIGEICVVLDHLQPLYNFKR